MNVFVGYQVVMTQSASNKFNNYFSLRSVKLYLKKTVQDSVIKYVALGLLAISYKTLTEKSYWLFIKNWVSNLVNAFISLFSNSFAYSLGSITLITIMFWLFREMKVSSWIDKVPYNQNVQTTFYTSKLLKKGANISDKEDLLNFCQDTVNDLHSIFSQRSSSVNTTWLIPEGERLVLLCTNKNSKYKNSGDHFSFRAGEGVVGHSWEEGVLDFYSREQENKLYTQRNQCSDIAYVCVPLKRERANEYGVLSVGSDEDIFWSKEDEQTLNLISTVVVSVLNGVDDEIKAELNLQTL